MKAGDIIHFSCHSIRQNKTRSAVTAIAVYLLGILIMGLLCTAISLWNTTNQILKNKIKDVDFSVVYGSSSLLATGFGGDDYEKIKGTLEKNKAYISTVNVYFQSLVECYDFNFLNSELINLTGGELPDASLSGLNCVYLSESYKTSYSIGDSYYLSSDDGQIELTVCGFYKQNSLFGYDCFADVNYMFSVAQTKCDSLSVNYVKDENTDYNKAVSAYKALEKAIKNSLPQGSDRTYCAVVELVSENQAESLFFVGGAIIIAVVLLLLSVGSISNTMIISVDQNRKLSAIMRCIGVSEGDLYKIFICECAMTIIVGVALAFITLVCLTVLLKNLVFSLAKFIYGYSTAELSAFVSYVFPFYIPILTAVFFIAFTALFSIKVFKAQMKKNPVEVLSGEML